MQYFNRFLPTYYPPDERGWARKPSAKWLWLAAQRPPWSPASHAAFPPQFRDAARALLLAAHRSTGTAALGALPEPLMLRILGQAAYPVSAWRPSMDTRRTLEQQDEELRRVLAEDAAYKQMEMEMHRHF